MFIIFPFPVIYITEYFWPKSIMNVICIGIYYISFNIVIYQLMGDLLLWSKVSTIMFI